MLLTQETFSPAQQKEWEALFEQFEFVPGKSAGRTRSFSFDGLSHCTCLPEPTHIKESMTLTVGVTSPSSGNNIKTSPVSNAGGGKAPSAGTPLRKVSEARRKELKEQAREDLGSALEEAWKAHGLSVAVGLNYGLALSTVLDELGQTTLINESNTATTRVINDYRIIKDPPDRQFRRLAAPRATRAPSASLLLRGARHRTDLLRERARRRARAAREQREGHRDQRCPGGHDQSGQWRDQSA